MAQFQKQNTVTFETSSGNKKGEIEPPFGVITERELQIAYRFLDNPRNSTPVLLYVYMALQKNGIQLDFSPAALQNKYGIAKARWRDAFKVLVKQGFLTDGGKHHYTFHSLPKIYRNITFLEESGDGESSCAVAGDRTLEAATKEISVPVLSPTAIGTVAGSSGTVADGYSNKKQENNIYTRKDDGFIYPENITNDNSITSLEKIEDDAAYLEREAKELENTIMNEFGYWDRMPLDIFGASSIAGRRGNRQKNYIAELEKLLKKHKEHRMNQEHISKIEYRAAIKRTMPDDPLDYCRVKMILDKFQQDYKDRHNGHGWPWTWGVWVNGWNEEEQEPNLFNVMPLGVLEKMQHNLDGIPKEYYKGLKFNPLSE